MKYSVFESSVFDILNFPKYSIFFDKIGQIDQIGQRMRALDYFVCIVLLVEMTKCVKSLLEEADEEVPFWRISGVCCPILRFPCTRMPNICANIRNALRRGKPSRLVRNTNRKKIRRNRSQSGCYRLARRRGYNCDEYPFASTFQGGRGAVVRLVPIRENSIQGGMISAFYRRSRIGHDDCFILSLII